MKLEDMDVLVTGGAGFIGSHLCDGLVERGNRVTVIDDLSTGKRAFIDHLIGDALEFCYEDILELEREELAEMMRDHEVVFHLAANPDVRSSASATAVHFDQNVVATFNVLEAMVKSSPRYFGFTSTSTVYGDATVLPTPEDYGPLVPISIYGASKLACEALMSAYCATFDIRGASYRFANCVGPRSNHGVTYDFVHKLLDDPDRLEILGDGRQKKSYFHVEDCVDGMVHAMETQTEQMEYFNIGSKDAIDVTTLATIVTDALELDPDEVAFEYTGGVDGGRGWKGDVKYMHLAIDKLTERGWEPTYSSAEAIRLTAQAVLEEAIGDAARNDDDTE